MHGASRARVLICCALVTLRGQQPSAATPPDWPGSVQFIGTENSVQIASVGGKPNPVTNITGTLAGWSVCSSTSPHAQLHRNDFNTTTPLPGGTSMTISASGVQSCPLHKSFTAETISDSPPICLAVPFIPTLGWPLPCGKCQDLVSIAKAVCKTWMSSPDTVRGIKATKWVPSGCRPGALPGIVATQQLIVWYDADDGTTPLRLRNTLDETGTIGGQKFVSSTVMTQEITGWHVGSIGAEVFAHCTPNSTASEGTNRTLSSPGQQLRVAAAAVAASIY